VITKGTTGGQHFHSEKNNKLHSSHSSSVPQFEVICQNKEDADLDERRKWSIYELELQLWTENTSAAISITNHLMKFFCKNPKPKIFFLLCCHNK